MKLCAADVFDFDANDVPAAERQASKETRPQYPNAPIVAVPEHSHPGESASNGKAESAVRTLVDQARTLKVALEARLGCTKPLPC